MSDQELRDKLANEYHGNVRGAWAEDFKAGWDAARANPRECNVTLSCDGGLWECQRETLLKERDQLRAEVERLQQNIISNAFKNDMFQLNRKLEKELEAERDEHFITKRDLKAQCEKLAEALQNCSSHAYEIILASKENRNAYFDADDIQCIADEALAEYRKSKGE